MIPGPYRFFPSVLAFFLVGTLLYHVYRVMRDRKLFRPWWGWAASAVTFGCVVFYPVNILGYYHDTCYFVVIGLCIPLLFLCTQHSRADRWIGNLSYPLYISHVLTAQVLIFTGHFFHEGAWIVALMAAAALLLLVDQPVDGLRHRWKKRRLARPVPGTQADLAPLSDTRQ